MAEYPLTDPLLAALRAARPISEDDRVDAGTPKAQALLTRILAPDERPTSALEGAEVPRRLRPGRVPVTSVRSVRRLALAGAVAAAVLAGGIVLVERSNPAGTDHPRTGTNHPSHGLPGVREVVYRTKAALAAASGQEVEHTRTTLDAGDGSAGQVIEQWSYGGSARTVVLGADGSPVSDLWYERSGCSFSGTAVSYADRAWWPVSNTTPMTVMNAGPFGDRYLGTGDVAASIQQLMASGQLHVVGNAVVDDQPTIELSGTALAPQTSSCGTSSSPASPEGGPLDQVSFTLWVDPSSYLPIQESLSARGMISITSTIQWLPASEVNTAQLQGTTPPAFTQLSGPPSSDGRVLVPGVWVPRDQGSAAGGTFGPPSSRGGTERKVRRSPAGR